MHSGEFQLSLLVIFSWLLFVLLVPRRVELVTRLTSDDLSVWCAVRCPLESLAEGLQLWVSCSSHCVYFHIIHILEDIHHTGSSSSFYSVVLFFFLFFCMAWKSLLKFSCCPNKQDLLAQGREAAACPGGGNQVPLNCPPCLFSLVIIPCRSGHRYRNSPYKFGSSQYNDCLPLSA